MNAIFLSSFFYLATLILLWPSFLLHGIQKKKKKKETQSLVMAEHGVVALKLSRLSRFDWSGVVVCAFVHFL